MLCFLDLCALFLHVSSRLESGHGFAALSWCWMYSALLHMQVLAKALEVWSLNLHPLDSPDMRQTAEHPEQEDAFICNLQVSHCSHLRLHAAINSAFSGSIDSCKAILAVALLSSLEQATCCPTLLDKQSHHFRTGNMHMLLWLILLTAYAAGALVHNPACVWRLLELQLSLPSTTAAFTILPERVSGHA